MGGWRQILTSTLLCQKHTGILDPPPLPLISALVIEKLREWTFTATTKIITSRPKGPRVSCCEFQNIAILVFRARPRY